MVKIWLRARVVAIVAAAGCLAGGVVAGVPAVPAAAASAGAVYVPAGPVRVLDTRNGTGRSGPLGPNASFSLQVAGTAEVPSGATAVVLNVTVTGPTASSFVTVYPDLTARPTASNLNFTAGQTIPNLVTVPVGSDGRVAFYNHTGSVGLVADLAGYYTASGPGSLLASTGPVRVLDTRNGTGGHTGPVGPNATLSLQVTGSNGVPPAGVTAVVLNVTATNPTASSFVTVYPHGAARPVASNLNFTAGQTIPNLVIVPVGTGGQVSFYNHTGSVNLVADLAGFYYTAGASYTPLAPVRVLDTRNGTGHAGAVGPNATISLQVTGNNGVPAPGVSAVVLNVTATGPTASSFVTAYPDGQPRPTASNLNFTAGQTIPNLVVVPVGADGKVNFYNHTGTVNLVADLAGYYTAGGPPWGNAIEVPGTGSLNSGATATVDSVSCPSAGNCTVGGQYADKATPAISSQAFVADEVNGTWGKAIEVPGTGTLNVGDYAYVSSVSCPSAGNCGAGGEYTVSQSSGFPGNEQAFVVSEVNGTWGSAVEVPGLATLNTGNNAQVLSVSCASAGNCAAGGYYTGSSGTQAFVADEVSGVWGNAIEVPGTATLNTLGGADVFSVSCPSAGNCAVGGNYGGNSGTQAFVADEVSGVWGNAIEVPGTAALNTGGGALVSSVSCSSAGNCTAGGGYSISTTTGGNNQAFVVSEVNGTWGNAIEVPGTATLNTGDNAFVDSVSCSSAGNCVAGGEYADSSTTVWAFVDSEVNGTWDNAVEIPGTGANARVSSVSCPSAGNCAAGGYAASGPNTLQAFVASEVNGTWGESIQVPGLNTPAALVASVSCPPTGSCAAGGEYIDAAFAGQAFVVSQN